MANYVGKFVLRKFLRETASNNYGKSDTYFEQTPATKLNRNQKRKFTSSKRKLRKALPPGLSQADQETLVKVKRRAYMLDMSLFSLFGIRFGWSSVIGFVPGIGDVIDLLFSLLVIRSASEASLPSSIQSRMMLNLALDFLVGLVPILGDLADAAYKANTRNAIILEDYLRERGAENIKKQGITPPRDMSLPEEYEQQPELNPSTAVVEFTGHGRQTETVIQGGDVEAQRKKSKKSKKHRPKEHESSGHGSHGQEPSGPHGSSRHGSSSGGHHSSGEHHSSGR